MIEFEVLGVPTGKGRPRACNRGGHAAMYTPAKTVQAEQSFLAQAVQYKPVEPLAGPLSLHLGICCPIPASWSKPKRCDALAGILLPTTKPDLDNVIKLVCDAMNGVFYLDDKQIVSVYVVKRYSATPKIRVILEEYTNE